MYDYKQLVHHDGFTDSPVDSTELPVTECVRTAQERTAWNAKVSLALAFDPQE